MELTLGRVSPIRKIQRFMETDWFIYIVAAFIAFMHMVALDFIALTALIGIIVFVCLSGAEYKCMLPPLLMGVFCVSIERNPEVNPYYMNNIGFLIALAVVLIVSLVYSLFKRRLRPKFSVLMYSFCGLSVVFIFGGIFSADYNPLSMPVGMAFSFFFAGMFALFSAGLKKTDFDYVAKTCLVASAVLIIELLCVYITSAELRAHVGTSEGKDLIHLGWGVSNSIGILITMMMPFTIYYMSKSRRAFPILWFAFFSAQMLAVVLTFSRGSMLLGIPTYIGGLIYCAIKLKKAQRIILLSCIGAVVAVGLLVLIWKWDKIMSVLAFYIEAGFSNRGRNRLFDTAFANFLENPIFGVGTMNGFGTIRTQFLFYHNDFLQFMVWGGAIGLALFIVHLIFAVYTFFAGGLNFKKFTLGLATALTLGLTMVECVFFFPYVTFYYVLYLAMGDLITKDGGVPANNPDLPLRKADFRY